LVFQTITPHVTKIRRAFLNKKKKNKENSKDQRDKRKDRVIKRAHIEEKRERRGREKYEI